MVASAHDHGERLRFGQDTLAAASTDLNTVGAGSAEDPVAVHVGGLGCVDEAVARGRVKVDLCAASEGSTLEEGNARARRGFGEVQCQVGTVGQGRVVDSFGGQSGPDDVTLLRLGQHVGGGADRPEHVVAWVGQGGGAHEARVGGDRESC